MRVPLFLRRKRILASPHWKPRTAGHLSLHFEGEVPPKQYAGWIMQRLAEFSFWSRPAALFSKQSNYLKPSRKRSSLKHAEIMQRGFQTCASNMNLASISA